MAIYKLKHFVILFVVFVLSGCVTTGETITANNFKLSNNDKIGYIALAVDCNAAYPAVQFDIRRDSTLTNDLFALTNPILIGCVNKKQFILVSLPVSNYAITGIGPPNYNGSLARIYKFSVAPNQVTYIGAFKIRFLNSKASYWKSLVTLPHGKEGIEITNSYSIDIPRFLKIYPNIPLTQYKVGIIRLGSWKDSVKVSLY